MKNPKITRNETIEVRAEGILQAYAHKMGVAVMLPVPIDTVLLQVYSLSICYDEIPELAGETILGGIVPSKRMILVNEKHLDLFEQKPGLERFTIGHEAGHWEFHVDKGAVGAPTLFAGMQDNVRYRSTVNGEVVVFDALTDDETVEQFLAAHRRLDTQEVERVANRFSAALTMPRSLMREHVAALDPKEKKNWYRLAELFCVTPTAMRVRLCQLGYIHVDDQGKIHASKLEAAGQMPLPLL